MPRLEDKVAIITGGAAGIGLATVHEQTTEHFDRVMAVNVRGVFLGMKYALPHMLKAKSGSIINMSSVAGLDGFGNLSPYVASKHAVVGLTKSAALEAASSGVRVNSVHPSPIHTRMMRAIKESMNPSHAKEVQSQFEQNIPMQHYGEPIDVANLVLFLASDDSSFITGCQYRVDGGMGAS